VVIDLDGGGSIAAIVTQGSVKLLSLAPGVRDCAFKATSVIVAVTA
jgi:molybdate transport system regulatory protein